MVAARAARAANHFSVLHQTRRHSVSLDHRYLDDGASGTASDAYNVSVTVDDGHGGTDSVSGTITVANLPPVISTVTGPSHPLALGTAATVSVNFSDVGTLDTHTVRFNWDDGTDDTVGASSSASHTYAKAGVYTVRVTVTDDDTGVASTSYEFTVVYDPNGGFVTGGGWINSPAGAYLNDASATGKASFGFVSKYLKGANVPTGATEFQFRAGNFSFESSAYEWLVVSGASCPARCFLVAAIHAVLAKTISGTTF